MALYGSESRAACANFVAGSGGMLPSMVKFSMAELKAFLILLLSLLLLLSSVVVPLE